MDTKEDVLARYREMQKLKAADRRMIMTTSQKTHVPNRDKVNEMGTTEHVKKKKRVIGYFADYEDHPGTALRPTLFWEHDMSKFDYQKMIRLVVQRVIKRGGQADFYAMLNLYGWDRVIETIKILPYLGERNMNFASKIFNISIKSMKCSRRPSWRQGITFNY